MNRIVFLLIFLLIGTADLSAQNHSERLNAWYEHVTFGKTISSQYDDSIHEVEELLKEPTLTSTDRLKGLLVIAKLQKLKGDDTKALEVAEQALVLAKKEKDPLWQARLLGFLSFVYRTIELVEISKEKLNEAMNSANKAPKTEEWNRFYASAYHEKAYHASYEEKHKEAIDFLHLSNTYLEEMNNDQSDFLLASNYYFEGILFNKMNEADQAILHFNKSIKLIRNIKDVSIKIFQNYIYTHLGYSYLLKDDLEASATYLNIVLNDSAHYKTVDLNQHLFENFIAYYDRTQDTINSKAFKNQLDNLNNSILKSNKEAVNAVTLKLNNENKLLKKSKKSYYWFSLLVIPLLFLFMYPIYTQQKDVLQTAELKKDPKLDELKIAKETEDRLVEQIKIFEQEKQFLTKKLSSSVMANMLKTNGKYITHILNKMYGQDFYTYINTLKINYVVDKLENDLDFREYKLSYIAEISGFSSHSKFAEVFKKIKGCSPSEYIQQIKASEQHS